MNVELPSSDSTLAQVKATALRAIEGNWIDIVVNAKAVLALVECAEALRSETCVTLRVYGVPCKVIKCSRCAALAKLEAL